MINHRLLYVLLISLMGCISGCSNDTKNRIQGYIEGDYTYMATSVAGRVITMPVVRGTKVTKGQTLFTLEAQPESDAYQAALENLKETMAARDAIKANLTYARLTFERYRTLVPKQAIQQSELDNARSNYNSTLAQLSQANANIAASEASLAQAKWTKDQKIVQAPADGIVFDTYYNLGEHAEASKAILALLTPEKIKAIFFIEEAILGNVKLGDIVTVACNGCKSAQAKITFISPTAEYTPPIIYSTETSPKLIFRIEADFATQDAYRMHPGQPVTVTLPAHGK